MNSMTSRPKKSPSWKEKSDGATAAPATKPARRISTRTRRRSPRPAWTREFLASLRPGIERQTELMPWLIADSVLGEAIRWLHTDLPPEWADWLDARAERCFARHRQFHRLISARTAGRENLYKFMRHWLASRLARERRRLFDRLPRDYALGCPLSAPRPPARVSRVGR